MELPWGVRGIEPHPSAHAGDPVVDLTATKRRVDAERSCQALVDERADATQGEGLQCVAGVGPRQTPSLVLTEPASGDVCGYDTVRDRCNSYRTSGYPECYLG
jgi:hypothetical protein